MIISIIAAVAKNRVIGNKGKLPWYIPEDLQWFKKITMGKPVIMGRKTFLSISKPLKGRKNIVLSQKSNFSTEGCLVFNSLDQAIKELSNEKEIVIIGGEQIYKQALPLATRMYLTLIDKEFAGDIYFPEYKLEEWECVTEERLSNMHKYHFACKHVIYSRI